MTCSFFANVAAQFGSPRLIDGHVALVPLSLNVGGVGNLRPNDPVPMCGKLSRDNVCQGIGAFCKKLSVLVPDLDHFLPCSLFTETGAVLRQLQNLAKHLAQFQYIRIVDKGAGELWGFCGAWVWDQVHDFMLAENFQRSGSSPKDWEKHISGVVEKMSLQRNRLGRLCVLYLLSKAKSFVTGKRVWRGLFASPSPVLDKQQLRLGARAMTTLLRLLQTEIPYNFQHAEIRTISTWFQFVAKKGARSLCEVDCKKQFDNINPSHVTTAFTEAADWLHRKRRWRQTQVIWSISRDNAKLDRAGEAESHRFWHLPHAQLREMLFFEVRENNFLLAAGSLWQRLDSIPMGGPFSAQSADLHTLWGVKTKSKKMRDLGALTTSDEGFPVWVRGQDWFSLAQFHDHVLIASSLDPGTHTTLVQDISSVLSEIWQLEVLCECITNDNPVCSRACLSSEIRALVVGRGSGTATVHPSALKQDWSLRYGPPLESPIASDHTYLSCIFSGALTAGLP